MKLREADYAAERLGLTKPAVWKLCRKGVLPHIRIGRKVLFEPTVLEAWIQAGGQPLSGGWREDVHQRRPW